jgi:5'-deoxynucleotidase YfbR-like HD superfamily hydrolase
MRAWQKMLSGRRVDLMNPSAIDIEIEDIAQGLSRVARWGGQTLGDQAFSVAQHSLLVEKIFHTLEPGTNKTWLLAALLNDASDYVVGDMVSPLKNALGFDTRPFEDKMVQAIHVRFGLPAVMPPALKKSIIRCDKAAAWLEATQIAAFSVAEANQILGPPPLNVKDWTVSPLPPNEAKRQFLERFYRLAEQAETAAA